MESNAVTSVVIPIFHLRPQTNNNQGHTDFFFLNAITVSVPSLYRGCHTLGVDSHHGFASIIVICSGFSHANQNAVPVIIFTTRSLTASDVHEKTRNNKKSIQLYL